MAQKQIVGSDSVKDALKTDSQDNFTELYGVQTEVVNARDGESTLLAQVDALQASIAAIVAGNVAWVYTAKTADYTVLAADLYGTKMFTNKAATATTEFSMPAGAAGYRAGFLALAAYDLRITANGTEKIRYLGAQTAAGGYIQTSTIGDFVILEWDSTQWVAYPMVGQWTDGTSTFNKATATVLGPIELATNAEVTTGSDTVRAVTPAGLQQKTASETALGIVELATTTECSTGTDTTRAVTPAGAKVSALKWGGPIGTIIAFGSETPPTNYLECDGVSLLNASYPDLYAVIGTAYGTADGTHFNIPDLRGKFPRGWDHAAANDPDRAARTAQAAGGDTGDHVGTIQADEYKSHTHMQNIQSAAGGATVSAESNSTLSTWQDGGITDASGGNETRPINVYVMFCIKYQ